MTEPLITAATFGQLPDGQSAQIFTLTNGRGLAARISSYGGTVTHLLAPDRDGKLGDVVLGFDTLDGYLSPTYQQAGPYFGALIGRFGNRIKAGQFTLDGQTCQLARNNGPNHLHGGQRGFDKVLWQAEIVDEPTPALRLSYTSAAGEEGYPGTLTVSVVYALTPDNALRISYAATTDQATVLNLTNHCYFNLSAGAEADVLGHELQLHAERYTPVDDAQIPTGELRPVRGTAFDFTRPQLIGKRIWEVPGGYDHNWVLDGEENFRLVAAAYEPTSGRTLEVRTDQPGVQCYTGNFLDGTLTGKNGRVYGRHAGFCLETQHFPDSPNQPTFPSTVLRPGELFSSVTEYRFGMRS